MTREDIIRMAREAGFVPHFTRPQDAIVRKGYAISGALRGYKAGMLDIERFAALVAAAEREACAVRGGAAAMAGLNYMEVADAIRGEVQS